MKNKLLCFIICVSVLCLLAVSTVGAEPVDSNSAASLTLEYQREGKCFQGIEIMTYRVADIIDVSRFKLSGSFSDYKINIEYIRSQTEWREITSTLVSYIIADKIEPSYIVMTDENGVAKFENISVGLYLTTAVRAEDDDGVTEFESFMTVVPNPTQSGGYEYDVTAYPKCQSFVPSPKEIERKIVKQWKDSGFKDKRPEYVTVDILKDGVLVETKQLSSENNWTYSWITPDDGSKWTAVEREIPDDYTVVIVEEDNVIVITNVYEEVPPPPQTGQIFVSWPFLLAVISFGGLLIILSNFKKKKEV